MAKALASTPFGSGGIDDRCAAVRIRLENSGGNGRAVGGDEPQFIRLLRRQRLEIAGQENQTRPVADINCLALWLRRSLGRDQGHPHRIGCSKRGDDFTSPLQFRQLLSRLDSANQQCGAADPSSAATERPVPPLMPRLQTRAQRSTNPLGRGSLCAAVRALPLPASADAPVAAASGQPSTEPSTPYHPAIAPAHGGNRAPFEMLLERMRSSPCNTPRACKARSSANCSCTLMPQKPCAGPGVRRGCAS